MKLKMGTLRLVSSELRCPLSRPLSCRLQQLLEGTVVQVTNWQMGLILPSNYFSFGVARLQIHHQDRQHLPLSSLPLQQ